MNVLGGWEVEVEFICRLVGDAGELARISKFTECEISQSI
jgi:hypothetical protein